MEDLIWIREKEVREMTSISRSKRWQLEQIGAFPARIKLGARSVCWVKKEVVDWLAEKTNARTLGVGDQLAPTFGK